MGAELLSEAMRAGADNTIDSPASPGRTEQVRHMRVWTTDLAQKTKLMLHLWKRGMHGG